MDSNWFYLLRKFLASKVIQTKQPSLKWKRQQQTLPNGLHDILVEAHKYSHVIIERKKIHKLFARTTLLFHVLESRAQFPRRNHTNTFQPRFSIHDNEHLLGNDLFFALFPLKIKLLIQLVLSEKFRPKLHRHHGTKQFISIDAKIFIHLMINFLFIYCQFESMCCALFHILFIPFFYSSAQIDWIVNKANP